MAQHIKFNVDLPPGVFKAKYDGTCDVCSFAFEKGEFCHYVNGKASHSSCHAIDSDSSFGYSDAQSVQREPSYVVTGKRNHERKCECGLTHAGECG